MTTPIIALDFSSGEEIKDFLKPFYGLDPYVKVGMELYYKEGPQIVYWLIERGYRVFLDLKLHDIPNTVKQGIKNLSGMGVSMLNVHASGGSEMMKYAMEGLKEGAKDGKEPLLIAVTQLTSTSENMLNNELLIEKPLIDCVLHYAKNAKNSGLNGVVCSVHESKIIKETIGKDFITVTPGIRLPGDAKGDQARIATPSVAKENLSDFIVVGRSITKSNDPVLTYKNIIIELED